MRVAVLFTDGVGVGIHDPGLNPLARGHYLFSRFVDAPPEPLPAGGVAVPADARFGVPGRPQSASNQTALLTGLPAPELIAGHVLGFPNAPLRKLIQERSIVRALVERGLSATFANCYPAGYLDALGIARRASARPEVELSDRARRRLRPSATTCAFAAASVPLRTLDDLRAGDGLTHDLDGVRSRARGFDAPRRTPDEAAEIFWRVAEGQALTWFEHFLADEAGHAQDFEAAHRALEGFDTFARAVIATRPEDAVVLLCSDHGNVEDLSTRNHTLNEVAVMAFGAPGTEPPVRNLADVGRWVVALATE